MSSTVWISAVMYHVTHVCMSSCNFGVWASMDNGHIVFQTCENIARLTYANSQLPLLCEFFLIPATLLVFRFNHLCRELDHTTGMLYIESKICSYWSYCILLHLIASCLDVQIRGASKALERPNGFVFARRCHGTSWKHHPEAKPLGGKKRPLRIWDSSLRMRDAVEDEDAFPISYSGVSFWRSWSSSWFRPTSFLVLNRCLFYGIASKHPNFHCNRIYPETQQRLCWLQHFPGKACAAKIVGLGVYNWIADFCCQASWRSCLWTFAHERSWCWRAKILTLRDLQILQEPNKTYCLLQTCCLIVWNKQLKLIILQHRD